MARNDNSGMMHRRLANAYLSSVISIALVLFLVGVASLLLVNTASISDYFKENLKVSVLLRQEVTDEAAADFRNSLAKYPFIRETQLVSREQGISEMAELLGQDFMDVFETAPIPVSVDLSLEAAYVEADSLLVVEKSLCMDPRVDEVVYQRSLIDALNANLSRISLVLSVFIALLLFISFVLINNTIRLSVYARRFTVHTMKMVGATTGFIRRPFLLAAVFQGIFSALLAIMMLLGVLFVLKNSFVQLFAIIELKLLLAVFAIVIACGVAICVLSTYFVVGRLVRTGKDELYY